MVQRLFWPLSRAANVGHCLPTMHCNRTANDHPAHTFSSFGPIERFDDVGMNWSYWPITSTSEKCVSPMYLCSRNFKQVFFSVPKVCQKLFYMRKYRCNKMDTWYWQVAWANKKYGTERKKGNATQLRLIHKWVPQILLPIKPSSYMLLIRMNSPHLNSLNQSLK